MPLDIRTLEYCYGMLEDGMKPQNLPLNMWYSVIPEEILNAISDEGLTELAGTYGDKNAGYPVEYDHLILTLNSGVIDIKVYNRGIALSTSDDERLRRIHRVCCKIVNTTKADTTVLTIPDRGSRENKKIGRNTPCPCGSGKKYKKCCLSSGIPKRAKQTMQEVSEEISREIGNNPVNSLEEAQKIADRVMQRKNSSGLSDFSGLSPDQMYRFMHHPFSSPQIATFEDLTDDPEAPIITLFTILASALDKDGLKATATGNLPRQFCRDVAEVYNKAHPDRALPGGINSELDFMDLNLVRFIASTSGYIRMYKKRFLLTRKGREAIKKGNKHIYLNLLETYTVTLKWGSIDGYPDLFIVQQAFLYTIYLLQRYAGESHPDIFYRDKFLKAFPNAMDGVSDRPYTTAEEVVGHCYVSRSLNSFAEFFGLVKITDSIEPMNLIRNIQKLSLLDSLVTFHI